MAQQESAALLSALDEVAPTVPTACVGWTAHHIVAHLAAGSKEMADLIEEKLAGRPPRPTRLWEDREPPFRALPNDELRAVWSRHIQRKVEAQDALAQLGANSTFEFTGMAMSAAQMATHSRSEAAIHRWDIVGSDGVSDELLGQPELTAHAVTVLNEMPILNESSQTRVGHGGRFPITVVLRAADRPDVVLNAPKPGAARLALLDEGSAVGDAVVSTDAAQRLLIIWGRRPAKRPIAIDADDDTSRVVSSILWPTAVPWC